MKKAFTIKSPSLLLLILLLGLSSCEDIDVETTLPHINLSKLQFSDQNPTLSSFASGFSYYRLETSDSSLISEIHDAYFTDSTIAVFDYYLSSVLLFSTDGSFIKELNDHRIIAHDGSHIHQLYFDEKSDCLYLYTNGRMIHKYSSDGRYVESISTKNIIPFYIFPIDKNFLFYYPYPKNRTFDNYCFGIFNKQMELVNRQGYRDISWRSHKADRVNFPNTYFYFDTL